MTNARKRPSLPGPEYRIKVAFRVPMDYVFAWCTDYTPDDGRLEGEKYARRIIERSARRVVFEDLEDTKEGWLWNRDVVTLRPPNQWHMEGIASRADVTADYVLSNIEAKLKKAGCGLKDVVKSTVFLADIRGFEEMNEVYRAAFAPHFPARSTIEARLARPEFLVEIEVIAYRPDGPRT